MKKETEKKERKKGSETKRIADQSKTREARFRSRRRSNFKSRTSHRGLGSLFQKNPPSSLVSLPPSLPPFNPSSRHLPPPLSFHPSSRIIFTDLASNFLNGFFKLGDLIATDNEVGRESRMLWGMLGNKGKEGSMKNTSIPREDG